MARRRRRRRSRPSATEARARVDAYYRRVADALIEQIERGTAPWSEAWKPGERALPYNVKSGKAYRGGNSVWLASTASRREYSDERWGTYRQVKELGGQVRRGQKGCKILYWQWEANHLARDRHGKPLLDEEGRPVHETRALRSPRVYQYTVFNAEQCDGLPPRPPRAAARAWDSHPEAERVLRHCGAVIEHARGDRAYYDLRRDCVVLPLREQFPSGPSYYQSALHELGHWTGHPSRLNRQTLLEGIEHGFGSHAYAREELRAEISSLMTGDRLNIGHDPSRHAAYVDSWVQKLREDPREIYRAARDAQQMSDWLVERARQRAPAAERPVAQEKEAASPEREAGKAEEPAPKARRKATKADEPAKADASEKNGREAEPDRQAWLPGMGPQRDAARPGPSR